MQRLCITSHDFPSFDVIAFTETCEIMPIRVCKIIYCRPTLLMYSYSLKLIKRILLVYSLIYETGPLIHLIQTIIEIWWPFLIMQIKCFPILGFLRIFSMMFRGPHRDSLW